jgi:hypothetical protein
VFWIVTWLELWSGLLGGAASADGTTTPAVPKNNPTKMVMTMVAVIKLKLFFITFKVIEDRLYIYI